MICTTCPSPHELGFVSQRFGCPVRGRRIVAGGIRRRKQQGEDHEYYRPDLAAFPGDPAAHVGDDRSVRKLVDRRKREGWREGRPWDEMQQDAVSGTGFIDDLPDSAVDEAFREAQREIARGEA